MSKRFVCMATVALLGGTLAPFANAGESVHSVCGHSPTFVFAPPDQANLEEVSIQASQGSDGTIRGHITFPGVYLLNPPANDGPTLYAPEGAGWTWQIDVDTLVVDGNVAWVGGVILHDNRDPSYEGSWFGFTIIDNGAGANDPPDVMVPFIVLDPAELEDLEMSGIYAVTGNFTIR